MGTGAISCAHDVKQKRVDVVVQRLVIQEAFRQQAQVTAPRLLFTAVDFEKGNFFVTIDFVTRRVQEGTFVTMTAEHLGRTIE